MRDAPSSRSRRRPLDSPDIPGARRRAHPQLRERPEHDVRNGLLLRSDVHRLFDAGYVTVTPRYVVEVSHRVRDDFDDGENYLRMHGEGIVVPEAPEWRPDAEALA